jgi:diguanylate cyclase (GGDEF)-like protein
LGGALQQMDKLMGGSLREARAFVIRHRYRFVDVSAVAAVVTVVGYLAVAANIFTDAPHQTQKAETLELDEILLVCAVLLGGLIWSYGRLRRERRETARRGAAEREIRTLAFHDPLTGLPNRRQFGEALKAAAAAPPRAGGGHGVIMLDLNAFKRINDVFGHGIGDEVLILVGGRLSRAVRDGDLVARLGGDEFAILATQLSGPEAATSLALRIIDELQAPITVNGREHAVGAAIGIALTPQDGTEPAELMRKADIALYRAKGQGRSAMRFFESEMDASVRERDHIERELRRALAEGEIEPHYQPLVDLKSGRVREFEALARWTHPQLGSISPTRFIPIAEDCGLIAPLTDALLTRACTDAAAWPSDILLAFNISPVLLHDPGFSLRLMAVLGRTGFPPQRLELEITESALVRDLDAAQTVLGALRDAGVRIALDDFGTGYSSLYHLRNFKLDKIKIDRSFIDTMTTDNDSAAIVRALVGLGAGLGLDVTAEGVETEEQRQLLSGQGCSQAQGFLYSEAVDAASAFALIAQSRDPVRSPQGLRA